MNDSLLDELKNLNKVLKDEVKKVGNINNSTDVSIISGGISNVSPTSASIVTTNSAISANSAIPANLPFVLTYDNLSDFILKQSQELIIESIEAVKDIKATVMTTIDPEAIGGLAALIKSTTGALDTLNSLNIEMHKAKNTKELKVMDIESKKQLLNSKKPNQTVNIIANREEMMKLMEQADQKTKETPVIDAEFTEIKPKS